MSMRVVFWKDAADRKRCARERHVKDAHDERFGLGGFAPVLDDLIVYFCEICLATTSAVENSVDARLFDAHAAEHLPDDDLEVLGRDVGALQFVDFYHFGNDIVLRSLLAGIFEEFGQVGRAVGEQLALFNALRPL